ncbi:kinase-like protein [Melanomma pulvis-pyrius CBS 109.77]|uniref:non-specific serine/threonine protein kinase n=1 Tax=Melanomma pulvis-pyrius CBS 109.77 TaxID=1314802 RepID=A0A6A6XB17_9PLEO|nr:kinase-like protein [Melanomma pulvis-pyrius CBS 109.77]
MARSARVQASDATDFREHVEHSLVTAGSPSAHQGSFIPRQILRSYLTPDRLRKLLARPGDQDAVQNGYLTVFSILFFIGKGVYITYFIPHERYADEHLPFERTDHWPPECQEFFQQFFEAQWKFCPQPLRKLRLNDSRFPQEAIVPIIKCELLKDGFYSNTYKVDIHPEYDLLTDAASGDSDGPTTNTYVLKTCRERDASNHHREVEAYRSLMNQHDVSHLIARFHGSWIQNQTYHMLLEYVSGGTLSDFEKRTKAPSTNEDIVKFWENLVELVKPVSRIHRLPRSDQENKYLQGIHHDIKPANILVTEPAGPSKFDVTFKLADLGLTDFVEMAKTGEELNRRDAHGTQMYSAPECYRDDAFTEKSIIQAEPSKDIWSLGCVFSEAAVWSVLDSDGLEDYRILRTARTSLVPELKDTAYSGCFHDTTKVLDAVTTMHGRVSEERRQNDHIVSNMIMIIDEMLEDKNERPDAMKLLKLFGKALEKAKNLTGAKSRSEKQPDDIDDASFPEPYRTRDLDVFRAYPPELPPEEICGMGLGIASTSPQSPCSFGASTRRNSNGSHPNSWMLQRYHSDYPRNSVASSPQILHRKSTSNHNGRHSSGSGHLFSSGSPTARRNSGKTYEPTLEEDEITPVTNGYPITKRRVSLISQHASNANAAHSSISPPSLPDPITMRNGTGTDIQKKDCPTVSVGKVLAWIAEKKKNHNIAPLEGHENLGRLHGRDQVFLIDNSRTMKDHWDKVKDTLNALGYLVKRSDLDGIDLYFTNSPEEGHSKHMKKLIKVFNGVHPGGECNMKVALGKILERYPERIKEQDKVLFSRKRKKQKWGLSVYVFTDAQWNGHDELCGVHEPIATLVNKLIKHEMLEHHVGIQFIRFGNDAVGARRLERLDSGLRDFGVSKDIVDTEDFDGDVWKMLFGLFDPAYDNDPPRPYPTPGTM